jgi:hypothetical protein
VHCNECDIFSTKVSGIFNHTTAWNMLRYLVPGYQISYLVWNLCVAAAYHICISDATIKYQISWHYRKCLDIWAFYCCPEMTNVVRCSYTSWHTHFGFVCNTVLLPCSPFNRDILYFAIPDIPRNRTTNARHTSANNVVEHQRLCIKRYLVYTERVFWTSL